MATMSKKRNTTPCKLNASIENKDHWVYCAYTIFVEIRITSFPLFAQITFGSSSCIFSSNLSCHALLDHVSDILKNRDVSAGFLKCSNHCKVTAAHNLLYSLDWFISTFVTYFSNILNSSHFLRTCLFEWLLPDEVLHFACSSWFGLYGDILIHFKLIEFW